MLSTDEDFHITYANDGFLSLIQYSRAEFEEQCGKEYLSFVHPDERETLKELIKRCCKENDSKISTEIRIRKQDGSYTPTLFNGTFVTENNSEQIIYCVIMDISVQSKLLEELKLSQDKYEKLMEQTGDILFDIIVKEKRIVTSQQFDDKFGWSFLEDMNIFEKTQMQNLKKISDKDVSKLLKATEKVLTQKESVTCEVRFLKQDKTPVWCEIFQFPMLNQNGEVTNIIGRIVDIDEAIQERIKLQEASRKDTLTGLYTKTAFNEISERYLTKNKTKDSAVIFMDLDYFKSINDTFGHMAGDQAIVDAAKKLQLIFSNIDVLSRFGGDEFCVLVKDIPMETLIDKLEWMLEKMAEDYSDNEGNCIHVTCSIGVAYTKECGNDIKMLLECADKALYQAKNEGRNRYFFYRMNQEEM